MRAGGDRVNAETMIVQYLKRHLDEHVSTDVPPERPARFLTVERTGGTETRFASRPMLAIQVWGGTRTECGNLAQKVKAVLFGLTSLTTVSDVQVMSLTDFPEPGQPAFQRYQIVIQVTMQATD